jgi:protein-L-isoaspartate(D-aspartate) O-methyltransferase
MDVDHARHNMIVQQIRPWDVSDDDVLKVISQMPRERFVPERFRDLAFADTEVPIGHGQVMMAPRVEARVLQALQVEPGDRVLEIGTGSGYLTACLSWMSGDVTTVDIIEEFTHTAGEKLRDQGITHVTLLTGDAMAGPMAGGPFDVIAVTGSLPRASDHFADQLAVGGRLFQVVGQGPAASAEYVTCVREGVFTRETLFETALAPLINAPMPERFTF